MRAQEFIAESIIETAKTSLRIGDVISNANQAVNAARQLNAKVVKTVAGYYKIAPLDDPRPAVTTNVDYYNTQRQLNKEIQQLGREIWAIKGDHNSERFRVFDKLEKLFPGQDAMNNNSPKRSAWLRKNLYALDDKYFGTPEFKQLQKTLQSKKTELKQLVDSNKRTVGKD
jgi:hypothetical protein